MKLWPLSVGLPLPFSPFFLATSVRFSSSIKNCRSWVQPAHFSWDNTISIFQRWAWAIQGLMLTLGGTSLSIGPGDWYWNPSRVIPPGGGNEITEFPLFTFIYSDLHAHMIAIPLALLALSWGLAVVAGRAKWRNPLSAVCGTPRWRTHHRRILSSQSIRYLYLFADRYHRNWICGVFLYRDILSRVVELP